MTLQPSPPFVGKISSLEITLEGFMAKQNKIAHCFDDIAMSAFITCF